MDLNVYVTPLLASVGLQVCHGLSLKDLWVTIFQELAFTTWWISKPVIICNPLSRLYIFSICTILGQPRILQNNTEKDGQLKTHLLTPGEYIGTEDGLNLQPELECVFADIKQQHEDSIQFRVLENAKSWRSTGTASFCTWLKGSEELCSIISSSLCKFVWPSKGIASYMWLKEFKWLKRACEMISSLLCMFVWSLNGAAPFMWLKELKDSEGLSETSFCMWVKELKSSEGLHCKVLSNQD